MIKYGFLLLLFLITISSCKKADRMVEVKGFMAKKSDSSVSMYANTSFVFFNLHSKRALSSRQYEQNIIPFTTDNNGYFNALIPIIDNSELRICWPDANSPAASYLHDVNMGDIRDNKINLDTIFVY